MCSIGWCNLAPVYKNKLLRPTNVFGRLCTEGCDIEDMITSNMRRFGRAAGGEEDSIIAQRMRL